MGASLWYEKGTIKPILQVDPKDTIFFDTETTGLDPSKDEILQICIVDGNENVLFSSYIKPDHKRKWDKATEVNGITYEMVKDSPKFNEVGDQIAEIFDKAKLIVGYNLEFDLGFLENEGITVPDSKLQFDVMQEVAPVHGKFNEKRGDFTWCKLSAVARKYKYKFKAHDALEDTKATRFCFYAMLNDHETEKFTGYLRVVEIYAEAEERKRVKAQEEQEKQRQKALEEKRAKMQEEERLKKEQEEARIKAERAEQEAKLKAEEARLKAEADRIRAEEAKKAEEPKKKGLFSWFRK